MDDQQPHGALRYEFADFKFSTSSQLLMRADEVLHLENKVRDGLVYFLEHAGEVVTRDEILLGVWESLHKTDQSVTTLINKLRKVLGDDAIATVHGVGYRFTLPVQTHFERKAVPKLGLKVGDRIQHRPNWVLKEALAGGFHPDVWVGEHQKTGERRVFKFAADADGLRHLRREITLSRLVSAEPDLATAFIRIADWQLDETPYFIEAPWIGQDLGMWAENGHLAALDLSHRLAWVADLAEHMGRAHAIGVIHKDLKPSNLLVNETESATGPRLIIGDFGSGRLLSFDGLEALGITKLGFTQSADGDDSSLSGTALYLAPELLAGESPTTQADIYSLGVILYQMVIGDLRRPLAEGWQERIDDPILREDIAAAAQENPRKRLASALDLAQRLRTLDQRRQARKEAAQVEQAAAKLRTTEARRRAQRPWQWAAATALAVGALGSVWFGVESNLARKDAEVALQRADAARRLLTDDLLGQIDPYFDPPLADKVAGVFASGRDKILEKAGNDPLLLGDLHAELGRIFLRLSRIDEAQREAEEALNYPAPTSDEQLERQAMLLDVLAFTDPNGQKATEIANTLTAALSGGRAISSDAINALATQCYISGDTNSARSLFEQYFGSVTAEEVGDELTNQMALVNWINASILDPTDLDGAARALRPLREALEKGLIHRPVAQVEIENSTAQWHRLSGDAPGAIAALTRARAIAEAQLPADHQSRVFVYGLLGQLHAQEGNYEEALTAAQTTLNAYRTTFTRATPPLVRVEVLVADMLNRLNRQNEARELLSKALALAKDGSISQNLISEIELHLVQTELTQGNTSAARRRFNAIAPSALDDAYAKQTINKRGWMEVMLLVAERDSEGARFKAKEMLNTWPPEKRPATSWMRDLTTVAAGAL